MRCAPLKLPTEIKYTRLFSKPIAPWIPPRVLTRDARCAHFGQGLLPAAAKPQSSVLLRLTCIYLVKVVLRTDHLKAAHEPSYAGENLFNRVGPGAQVAVTERF